MRLGWIDRGGELPLVLRCKLAGVSGVTVYGYATMGEPHAGLTRYFAFYNGERPHQGLNCQTPDSVSEGGEGGGAMIVDK